MKVSLNYLADERAPLFLTVVKNGLSGELRNFGVCVHICKIRVSQGKKKIIFRGEVPLPYDFRIF